jgi:hypothetical protein
LHDLVPGRRSEAPLKVIRGGTLVDGEWLKLFRASREDVSMRLGI